MSPFTSGYNRDAASVRGPDVHMTGFNAVVTEEKTDVWYSETYSMYSRHPSRTMSLTRPYVETAVTVTFNYNTRSAFPLLARYEPKNEDNKKER